MEEEQKVERIFPLTKYLAIQEEQPEELCIDQYRLIEEFINQNDLSEVLYANMTFYRRIKARH
jgi:hypothetical protein